MSLFRTPRPTTRAIPDFVRGTVLDSGRTSSGESVTSSSAMRHGAVWSSVHLLSSVVSNLPVDVFRGSGATKTAVPTPPAFVTSPSLIVTRREWVYQAMTALLLRGNACGYVMERDTMQRPRTVEWLDPDGVTIDQKSALHHPTYKLGAEEVGRDKILHMRAFVRAGSAIGMSPIAYHAEKIGVGLAAEKFGAQFYGGGGHPTALFQNKTQTIDPVKAEAIKDRIIGLIKGKREPLVLGSDWDYKPLQVSPAESAFLDAQGYTDAQIARIFGPGVAEILGYAGSGSSLTYSNRVDRSLDLLTYTVMHWVNKFDDMWTANIAQPQTARMNVSALLRADLKAQMEMFRTAREIGLYNVDEERGFLDMPPLPNGQGEDYTPLKLAAPQQPQGGSEDVNQ